MATVAKGKQAPPVGSASFWDMAALAMGGRLASCQSCVEFFYFQSKQNAVAFLDSCAAGGLVERMSLIDLRVDLDPVSPSGPTLRQEWYDQAIYISAPAYRMHNLDASRDRIEGTKNAVYDAFRLYHEKLKTNNDAIDSAYNDALKTGDLLRYSATASDRKTVDLSHVAKLRLIQDGFKCVAKSEGTWVTPSQVERRATDLTIEYVISHWDAKPASDSDVCDHVEELDSFISEFLDDHRRLQVFWEKYETRRKFPSRSQFQMLRVINHLIRYRLKGLEETGGAVAYRNAVLAKLNDTGGREKNDLAYVAALADVAQDINLYHADLKPPMPFVTDRNSPIRTEAR